MSKKKSFSSKAFDTITGNNAAVTNNENKVNKSPITNSTKQAKKEPKVEKVVSRSNQKTGKPVTLYLNKHNYEIFKSKVKSEGKSASQTINEMIYAYISI